MTKTYRLTAPAQMDGEVRQPGYQFTLEPGQVGPHRTVLASQHGAQLADHLGGGTELTDVPLYEEVVEKAPAPPAPPEPSIDELKAQLAAATGKVAALERETADKDAQLADAHQKLAAVETVVKAATGA